MVSALQTWQSRATQMSRHEEGKDPLKIELAIDNFTDKFAPFQPFQKIRACSQIFPPNATGRYPYR